MDSFLAALFDRLQLPDYWGERNRQGHEYVSEHSDSAGQTLQQIMEQKFPGLMQQYKFQDQFQKAGPDVKMTQGEIAWRNAHRPYQWKGDSL